MDSSRQRSDASNVFIKNLDIKVNEKILYDIFFVFGNILSCKIAQDEKGISKGYGIVHFEKEEAANCSIEKLNGMELLGKKISVGYFFQHKVRDKAKTEKKNVTNIYVKNFGENMSDNELFKMFEPFGKITNYKVFKNDNGKSKGYGFVAYETSNAAKAAINTMNAKQISEGMILNVGYIQPKKEQLQELRHRFEEIKSKMF